MSFPSFSAGEVLTAADMNAVGLWKVASTTFNASPGVEMQNCFTSDYRNYLVQVSYYGSAATNTFIQYMTGTNTKDTAATYNRYGFYFLGSVINLTATGQTSEFVTNHGTSSSTFSTATMTIFSPAISGVHTNSSNQAWASDSALNVFLNSNKAATTAYTGLYFAPATATTITGTITIYGMRN
jgi:hypothetical protein